MQTKDFQFMYMAIQKAEKRDNMTFLDGIRAINLEMGESDLRYIREDGAVYFNRVGGKTFSVDYVQFCRRKNLVFPDFKASDIRVKQQTGGTHYYAYIGDMQVRDRDILKWINRDDNVQVNAVAALSAMGAKGYYAAVKRMAKRQGKF